VEHVGKNKYLLFTVKPQKQQLGRSGDQLGKVMLPRGLEHSDFT